MNIEYDYSYLNIEKDFADVGFADETVEIIRVQAKMGEEEEVNWFLDMLERRFKMYQYIKDNGVKFGEEELFYWCGESKLYFTLTVKAETLEQHEKIVDDVLDIVRNDFGQTNFELSMQMGNRKDWSKINGYLEQISEWKTISPNIISMFYNDMKYCGTKYSKESVEKLYALSDEYLEIFVDKKVKWNDWLGTVRKLSTGYAFFKTRAKRTYYQLNLGNVESLKCV